MAGRDTAGRYSPMMKIGIPRACTAKACASRGSGLGSTSRDRIPRGPVPPRPALTVYCGGAGQGGSVQPNCHLYTHVIITFAHLCKLGRTCAS
ncbi:hypothetical protein Bca52824_057081 [Brassica carinata]|uniref:Uncharacterized protein n=1 Tax=Brassica carinata TaxID=52824 RepID=A0A8X7QQT2_BRACI|nr:hypothetical protein Bca52824_057081 [Brassica carinata]